MFISLWGLRGKQAQLATRGQDTSLFRAPASCRIVLGQAGPRLQPTLGCFPLLSSPLIGPWFQTLGHCATLTVEKALGVARCASPLARSWLRTDICELRVSTCALTGSRVLLLLPDHQRYQTKPISSNAWLDESFQEICLSVHPRFCVLGTRRKTLLG
jgi:hypothetical protein